MTNVLKEFRVDRLEVAAGRMNAGEPVAESYVWGAGSDLLQRRGMVPHETMRSYRASYARMFLSAYGERAKRMAELRHGPVVIPFFEEAKANRQGSLI